MVSQPNRAADRRRTDRVRSLHRHSRARFGMGHGMSCSLTSHIRRRRKEAVRRSVCTVEPVQGQWMASSVPPRLWQVAGQLRDEFLQVGPGAEVASDPGDHRDPGARIVAKRWSRSQPDRGTHHRRVRTAPPAADRAGWWQCGRSRCSTAFPGQDHQDIGSRHPWFSGPETYALQRRGTALNRNDLPPEIAPSRPKDFRRNLHTSIQNSRCCRTAALRLQRLTRRTTSRAQPHDRVTPLLLWP